MAYARKEGYGMEIKSVMDPAFRRYGKVLTGYDFSGLVKVMKGTSIPDDVVYVPSVSELEEQDVCKELQEKGFGGMPIGVSSQFRNQCGSDGSGFVNRITAGYGIGLYV